MPKVLISDSMSNVAQKIFEKNNISVDVKTGLSEEEIIKIIPEYDGMVVRSATKVTKKIIEAAKSLKVIGRAGAGVDNIDVAVAKDINGYPKAPPSIRIWGGSTVQNSDMKALLPWIDWAYNFVKSNA